MKYLTIHVNFEYERKSKNQSIIDIIRKQFKAVERVAEGDVSSYKGIIGSGNSRCDEAIIYSKLPESKLKEVKEKIEKAIKDSGIKVESGKIEVYEKKLVETWNF